VICKTHTGRFTTGHLVVTGPVWKCGKAKCKKQVQEGKGVGSQPVNAGLGSGQSTEKEDLPQVNMDRRNVTGARGALSQKEAGGCPVPRASGRLAPEPARGGTGRFQARAQEGGPRSAKGVVLLAAPPLLLKGGNMLAKPNVLAIEELRNALREANKKKRQNGVEPEPCWQCSIHMATDVHHADGNHANNTPGNLVAWCKRCHNDHHGITDNLTDLRLLVREFEDIQHMRVAMGNRVQAYERLGYETKHSRELLEKLEMLEEESKTLLAYSVKREPIYQHYLAHVKGIGPRITISAMWAYFGLDTKDGKARRRKTGEQANWSQEGRRVCVGEKGIADQLMLRNNKPGRALYERWKKHYQDRYGDTTNGIHIERMVKRKIAKVFLSCLWVAWREMLGLPVSQPYIFDRMQGHSHLITPDYWMPDGQRKPWMEQMDLAA
jgi:hypothetical protein